MGLLLLVLHNTKIYIPLVSLVFLHKLYIFEECLPASTYLRTTIFSLSFSAWNLFFFFGKVCILDFLKWIFFFTVNLVVFTYQ